MTYFPAAVFGIGWVILGRSDGVVSAAGLLAAAAALVTVFTTGMIYASLKPIAQWHSRFTVPGYLIFALMTGGVLLNAILLLFGDRAPGAGIFALVAIAAGWGWKSATWRRNDCIRARLDREQRDRAQGRNDPIDRMAAHGRELCAEGDGLPDRPQARGKTAPARACPGLRRAARRDRDLALRSGA